MFKTHATLFAEILKLDVSAVEFRYTVIFRKENFPLELNSSRPQPISQLVMELAAKALESAEPRYVIETEKAV